MSADGKKLQKRSLSTIISGSRTQEDLSYNPSASVPNLAPLSKQDQSDVRAQVSGFSGSIIVDNYDPQKSEVKSIEESKQILANRFKSYPQLLQAIDKLFELAKKKGKSKEKVLGSKLSAVLSAMGALDGTPGDIQLRLSVLRAIEELFVFHASFYSHSDAQKIKENIDNMLKQVEKISNLSSKHECISFIEIGFQGLLGIEKPEERFVADQIIQLQNYLDEMEVPFLAGEDKLKRIISILKRNDHSNVKWEVIFSIIQTEIKARYSNKTSSDKLESEIGECLNDALSCLEQLKESLEKGDEGIYDTADWLRYLVAVRFSLIDVKDDASKRVIQEAKTAMQEALDIFSEHDNKAFLKTVERRLFILLETPGLKIGGIEEFTAKLRELNYLAKKAEELPLIDTIFYKISGYGPLLDAVSENIEWREVISDLKEKVKKQYTDGKIAGSFREGIGQNLNAIVRSLEQLDRDFKIAKQNKDDSLLDEPVAAVLEKFLYASNFLDTKENAKFTNESVRDEIKFSGIRTYAKKLVLIYKDIPWDKLISALEAEIKASHSKENWDMQIKQAVLHLEKLRKSLDNRTDMNDADSQEDYPAVAITVGEFLVFRNSLQPDPHNMRYALESMQLELNKIVGFFRSSTNINPNLSALFSKGIEETLLQLLVQPERQMSAGNVALLTMYLQNLLSAMQNEQQGSKSMLGVLDAIRDILIFRAKLLNAEAVSECNLIAEVLLKARNISENYRSYDFLAGIEERLLLLLLDPKVSVIEVANSIAEHLMVVEKELAEKLHQDLEQSLNLYTQSLDALSVPGLWEQSISCLFSDLKKAYVGIQLNLKAVEVKISLGMLKDSLERHENPPFSVITAMIDMLLFRRALLSQDEQNLETIKNLLMQALDVYKEKTNVARLKEFEDCLFELLNEPKLEEITIQLINKKLEGLVAVQKENRKKAINALKEDLHNKVYYREDERESESPDETKFSNRILARFFDLIDWGHTQEEKRLVFEMTDVFLRWFPKAVAFAGTWIESDFLEPLEAYKIAVEKNEEKIDLLVKIFKIVNTKLSFLYFIETNQWELPEKVGEIKFLLDKIFDLNKIRKIDEKALESIISRIKLLLLMPVVNEEAIAVCAKELKEIVSEVVIASEREIEKSIQVLEQDIVKKERELSSIEYTIAELKQGKIALERDLATETQALEQLTLEHDKSSAEQAQKLEILKQDREQKKAALLEKKEELSGVEKRISDETLAFEQKELEISDQKGKDKTTLEEIGANDKLRQALERRYQELQEKQAEKERAFVAAETALDKQIKEMSALKKVIESTQKKLDINYEKAAKSERKIKEDVSNLVDQLISDVNAIIAQHPYLNIKASSFSWYFRDSKAKKLSEDLGEFKKKLMGLKKQPNIDALNALIEDIIISIESSAVKGHKARSATLNLFLNNLGRVLADGSFEDAKVKDFASSASLTALRKRNGKIQQYGEMRNLISKATECHNEVERDFNETQKQLRTVLVKAASERDAYELQVKEELSDLERKMDQKKKIEQELRGRLMVLGQLEVERADCKDRLERYKEKKAIFGPETKKLQEAIALRDQEINELQRTLASFTATFEVTSQGHVSATHRLGGDLQTNRDKLAEKNAVKISLEAAKKKEESELKDKTQALKKSNELSSELKPVLPKQSVQQGGTEAIISPKTTPRTRNRFRFKNLNTRLGEMQSDYGALLPSVAQKKEDDIEQQQILEQKNVEVKKVQQETIADEHKTKSTGWHRFFPTLDDVSAALNPDQPQPEPLSFKT